MQITEAKLLSLIKSFFQSHHRNPDFGIELIDYEPHLTHLSIRITYQKSKTYCCIEPGCHFNFDSLKRFLREEGLQIPPEMTLTWYAVIEKGSRTMFLGEEKHSYGFRVLFPDYWNECD